MIISIVFLVIVIFIFFIYKTYLKKYIEVTKIFKLLRKMLEARDLLVLKLLPDVKKKKISEKILNLINDRNEKSKISYDDAIRADIALHSELKNLYDLINEEKKNPVQEDIFKRIIIMEKKIKVARRKYTEVVQEYNMSLTIHPNVCIKLLHMKPFEMYAPKNK